MEGRGSKAGRQDARPRSFISISHGVSPGTVVEHQVRPSSGAARNLSARSLVLQPLLLMSPARGLQELRAWVRAGRAERSFRKWNSGQQGAVNAGRLEAIRAKYLDRRCFIIGNGPSLNQTPVHRLKDEVTIGCNGLFLLFDRMGYVPTAYTVEDTLVAADRAKELNAIQNTIKVYPWDLREALGHDPDAIWVNFLRNYPRFPRFSTEFDKRCYWGGTVTFFNLQLACHLGCNPIYLIGIDHNYKTDLAAKKEGTVWTSAADDPNHFHPDYFGKGYRLHDPMSERMEIAYHCTRRVLEPRGIRVLNATVGGKLEVFPRVDIQELLG